jgi:mRNA-degrading endonuclease toxin of MazEF toxin-antitoxin module
MSPTSQPSTARRYLVGLARERKTRLTRVLVEQLGAVDVQRLGRRVSRLTTEEMWSVDDALAVVLGLD